jgi:hypothetical protein
MFAFIEDYYRRTKKVLGKEPFLTADKCVMLYDALYDAMFCVKGC